jgi:hypothetical protein
MKKLRLVLLILACMGLTGLVIAFLGFVAIAVAKLTGDASAGVAAFFVAQVILIGLIFRIAKMIDKKRVNK